MALPCPKMLPQTLRGSLFKSAKVNARGVLIVFALKVAVPKLYSRFETSCNSCADESYLI